MNDPDQELVRRAQHGDKNAYGDLVTNYYKMVYGICYGVLMNREAARDTAQDIFLKVYREIKRFKGQSKFKTWLYRVAMNGAIDQARKKKPQISLDAPLRQADEESRPMSLPDEGPGPREEAAREELRHAVREALKELSEDHRAILLLREWQNLSYEEIAESLNLETGTVMSRLHYARKKLAEILRARNQS